MNKKARFILSCCLLALTIPSAAMAAAGTMRGLVLNSQGEPIAKVTVILTGVDFEFEKVTSTSKKGKFSFTVPEAERSYAIRMEKEGYVALEQPVELRPRDIIDSEWVLATVDEAAEIGEQLQQLKSQDQATKAYNRGVDAYNAGEVDAAVEAFREAVTVNPELMVGYGALGRILLEQKRWAEAREVGLAFVERAPEEPLALQTLYDAYWGEGNKEEASKVLEKMLEVDSGSAVAARIFNQAVAATKAHDYDTAAEGFERAHELDPSIHQALLALAQIHYAKGEFEPAIERAEGYLEHDQGHARAHIVRYESYRKLGNQEAADRAFAELEAASPDGAAEVFLNDGINAFNDGSTQEAIEAVETSIALDPTNAKAYHQLGLCYTSAGNNTKARAAFEKFLELAPDDPEAQTVREMMAYLK